MNDQSLGKEVKDRNKKIVDLLEGIGSINLGEYQTNEIDAFGDAYEFLIGMYAQNAGQSGGEYFTPQEVSELLTRLSTVGKTKIKKRNFLRFYFIFAILLFMFGYTQTSCYILLRRNNANNITVNS